MRSQLRRLGISAERWGREAKLSPTTVTRAMAPGYKSVTSVSTLVDLAKAAGVPTVLDMLEQQAEGETRNAPSPLVVRRLLESLLPAAGLTRPDDATMERLAEALCYGLVLMDDSQDSGALRVAAQAAAEHMKRST